MSKKIFVVVPVFNEGPVIKRVIGRLMKAGYDNIIIIDDGSFDDTFEVRDGSAHYLKHALNRGKGAATKTGFEAAKILGADIVVTMDGDGQHDVKDISRLTKPILHENYDVVLGSRLFNSKEIPFHRVLYNKVGNILVWIFYGLWVTDSQSGLRAYSRRAIEAIDTKSDRYEFDSEVIREIKKNQLKYKEIPIKVLYTEYSVSKKNKQSLVGGVKTLIKMILSL